MKVSIYEDWQNQTGRKEEGELLEYISTGLPFILSEAPTELQQTVYCYQLWKVLVNKERVVKKIPYIYTTGIPTRQSYSHKERLTSELEKDSFLRWNGKEIF